MMQIDKNRLWADLQAMGDVGATPTGGVRRLALSVEDKAGRELFERWCRESNYAVRVDTMGNVFACWAGSDAAAAPVMTGKATSTPNPLPASTTARTVCSPAWRCCAR